MITSTLVKKIPNGSAGLFSGDIVRQSAGATLFIPFVNGLYIRCMHGAPSQSLGIG